MDEMDKLEQYLKEHHIRYWRGKRDDSWPGAEATLQSYGLDAKGRTEQIIVYDEDGFRLWDVIFGPGTYGYKQGLLEALGWAITGRPEKYVEGYLTAEKIIKRLEASNGKAE